MASHIRLRLAVRRNGLPDTNVVWPVALGSNPTIAKLLEQVNDIIPLESGEWGLEDYAVELQTSTGSAFECLHFQPIRDVLKEDDQVFIRPLFTDDLRRRRVSGRIQISNDGKHLLDGIAFGRPLLKTPRGRPALLIPPRKRRRVGFEQAEDEQWEEEDIADDYDYDYREEEEDDDEPMLLLTNGEEEHGERAQKRVRIAAEFDDLDQEADEEAVQERGLTPNYELDNEGEDHELDIEEEDLAQELEDLQNDLDNEDQNLDATAPTRTRRTRSALQTGSQTGRHQPKTNLPSNLEALDKIGALRDAFPDVPIRVCREILAAEGTDLKKSYIALLQGFKPKISESELLKRWRSRHGASADGSTPQSSKNTSSKAQASQADSGAGQDELALDDDDDESEHDEEGSDDDDVTGFIRRFDHQGLPPGSISSGNALEAMAALADSLSGGNSNTVSARSVPRKTIFNDDDDTSSSGTSSSSSSEDEVNGNSDQDKASEDTSSSDSDDDDLEPSGGANTGHKPDHPDTSSSDSDSDSDSDSAPEEASSKGGLAPKQTSASARASRTSSSNVSSDSDNSDADDETSSSDESSDDDSDEESALERKKAKDSVVKKTRGQGKQPQRVGSSAVDPPSQPPSTSAQPPVPPGQGKTTTQRRNARRRAAEKAKKDHTRTQSAEGTNTGTPAESSTSVSDETEKQKAREKELFEARRQALLDALASGGVEVGPNSPLDLDNSKFSRNSTKRKRVGKATTMEETGEPPKEDASEAEGGETQSPDSAQKRRRMDLGAGRRMVFSALGLPNPKTRQDEDRLRDEHMKDVRPLQNARLAEAEAKAEAAASGKTIQGETQDSVEEDPGAWRSKISYRAVECCQEGVELSEPPFPFVQRWDPQQQGNWFRKTNKRGGRGKKADRNQSHFYQDESQENVGSYDESQEWNESYYDDTLQTPADKNDADIVLNYDDVEPAPAAKDDTDDSTHLNELDDLPALPANLADLKTLLPGQAQCGMVITWKQFILSKTTNWQPQVLDLTGIICRIDDDAGELELMLAKRDRYLEEPEKEYDDDTGQRIYEKFDAPDVGDEEEDEEARRRQEGYRSLSLAAMMEPRIVQPAIPLDQPAGEPAMPSIEENQAEPGVEPETTKDSKDTDFEGFDDVAGESPETVPEATAATGNQTETSTLGADVPQSDESAEHLESLATGTAKTPSVVSSGQTQQSANIASSDASQILSPSHQLYETFTQFLADSGTSDGQPDISRLMTEDQASDPMVVDPTTSREEESSLQIHDAEVITGTPKALSPKPDVPPSSAGSVLSGHQPDHPMGMDSNAADSFLAPTNESIHSGGGNDDASVVLSERSPGADEDGVKTPTAPQVQAAAPKEGQELHGGPPAEHTTPKPTPKEDDNLGESAASTPCSLASLKTLWCTAATSRGTQSPTKSQLLSTMKSRKSLAAKANDAEYEAAMRKLDDFSEDEDSQAVDKKPAAPSSSIIGAANNDWDMNGISDFDPSSSPQISRTRTSKISPPPTNRGKGRASNRPGPLSASASSPKIKEDNSPPPTTRPRRSARSSKPKSTIPPDAVLLEISSDSDQPDMAEDYADDEVDENYEPNSLPNGPGGLKKNKPARGTKTGLASQIQKSSPASQTQKSSGPKINGRRVSESYASQLTRLGKSAAVVRKSRKSMR